MANSSRDFEPIKPADLPLTQQSPQPGEPIPWQQRRSTWVALAVCVLLALAVIFVLPALVTPPTTAPVAIDTGDNTRPAVAESPFRDAQLADARRAAQDILAQILEAKSALEDKNVQTWGAQPLEEALQFATTGDQQYRQRDFNLAQQSYQQALDHLQALEASIPQRLSAALKAGREALENGDAGEAGEQFNLALALDPDNEEASIGLERTAVLDEVAALLQRADIAVQNGRPEKARELYQQALNLDPQATEATRGIARIDEQLNDRAFNDAMSRGLAALENHQYGRAKAAFNEAVKLKPDDRAARTALDQASNAATRQTVQALIKNAAALEADEQWQRAEDTYARALAIDASLMPARLGQLRSRARAELDERIQKILDEPLRLSSDKVLAQARQTLADARGIRQPGARLSGQIDRLEQVLSAAVTPQTIEFLSDSDTRVTLYKVGELGQFNRKQLSLVPGNYVAVGSRPGYRDVRVEFQVSQAGRDKPVIVVCTEPVS